MISKWRYKIWICSVTQFDVLQKWDIFWFLKLPFQFLSLKILGFLFSSKNGITWEVKCEN